MELVFATNNLHKLYEVSKILPSGIQLVGLKDIGFNEEIPEPYETIEENAAGKSEYIFQRFSKPCFADDTGLEVAALGGKPGVYSARYAGEKCSAIDNVKKLLHELKEKENRNACFRTIIAFTDKKKTHYFEGKIKGKIAHEIKGEKGFGYDPVFVPDGYSKSFAEMELDEKNTISHRARAIQKFLQFIDSYSI